MFQQTQAITLIDRDERDGLQGLLGNPRSAPLCHFAFLEAIQLGDVARLYFEQAEGRALGLEAFLLRTQRRH